MHIVVIGTGYVGLVSGACFAKVGHQVSCIDIDQEKIQRLRQAQIPIYEPGLDEIVQNNLQAKRLAFFTHLSELTTPVDAYFIAVGTPAGKDGATNLDYVFTASEDIAHHLIQSQANQILIVNKSTSPVGTGKQIQKHIDAILAQANYNADYYLASNPEFLKEGSAIADCLKPDRVIIGTNHPNAKKILDDIYAPFQLAPEQMLSMGIEDAEVAKYAANAMLATRISFMNEIATLCASVGADISQVKQSLACDKRIGPYFLNAGCGYGGSCFPKDVKSLIHQAKTVGFTPYILEATEKRNQMQKTWPFTQVKTIFGEQLTGHTFAVWGLAFKPKTDDVREASSHVFIKQAIEAGAHIQAHDPIAIETAKKQYPKEWIQKNQLIFCEDKYQALLHADALIIITEWDDYITADLSQIKKQLKKPIIIDGRNLFMPSDINTLGIDYLSVGRQPVRD